MGLIFLLVLLGSGWYIVFVLDCSIVVSCSVVWICCYIVSLDGGVVVLVI